MSKQILIYNHGGSKNHGCEALARTLIAMIPEDCRITLLSEAADQDAMYGLGGLCEIISAKAPYSSKSLDFVKAYAALKIKKDYFQMDVLPYKEAIRHLGTYDIAVSIGGDVYCYDNYPLYIEIDHLIRRHAKRTVLLGCSIEKKLFDDPAFLKDIRQFDVISARESLTYDLLKKAGCQNTVLIPDLAFTLEKEEAELPEHFIAGNTVGINVSPLVIEREQNHGIILKNYTNLIEFILHETDMNVALIPHVVWDGNDDREPLKKLFEIYQDTGRVALAEDHDCRILKGFIAGCRFLIGARTHATIAAYSSCVPTLVLGYSIKSIGIATDLFGTSEGYVIPVTELKSENSLKDLFCNMADHENEIRDHLTEMMPDYIRQTQKVRELL